MSGSHPSPFRVISESRSSHIHLGGGDGRRHGPQEGLALQRPVGRQKLHTHTHTCASLSFSVSVSVSVSVSFPPPLSLIHTHQLLLILLLLLLLHHHHYLMGAERGEGPRTAPLCAPAACPPPHPIWVRNGAPPPLCVSEGRMSGPALPPVGMQAGDRIAVSKDRRDGGWWRRDEQTGWWRRDEQTGGYMTEGRVAT